MGEREIFEAALALDDAAARSAYLDQVCAGDAALREHLDGLLAAHGQLGSFLEAPASPVLTAVEEPPSREGPGMVIGPYKLLEQIGEGGFGVVFMAEQQQPVRRKIALKVLKSGMDTRQVVARFEAERQALALMDHPHIARVLDAGETQAGRPYFVMELVQGIPITEFCDANRLAVRQRLELFVTVCQAVQHAHQKGLIHRDLKPSNLLVTLHDGTPVVKVIDFGIAKALGQQLTDKTLFTGFAQMLGTPLYMSPEQAGMSGLDVDTRSDIYSLGVLLYELLTGTTPLDQERLSKVGYDELRRLIREEEPPPPSTRLSPLGQAAATVATNRQSALQKLRQFLRHDLDWVVMKALEKDRNRRYETATGFAQDIERYLRDEPVQAGPPSALYRFRKFARRNKGAMRAASVVAVVVVLAVAVSTGFIWRANRNLQQALEGEWRNGYVNRIALAARELEANDLAGALALLAQCPEDLRGWEWHYHNRRGRCQPLPTMRHDTAVLCAALSPKGDLIASSDQAGWLKLWDAHTGREIWHLQAHDNDAWGVAFSPDGRRLASCGRDQSEGTIRLWDVRTRQRLRELERRARAFNSVAFSPDGRRLAAGAGGGEVRVYEATAEEYLFSLHGHQGGVWNAVFSPDGQRLATLSAGYPELKIWDLATRQELLSFPGHRESPGHVAFSADGRLVASGTWGLKVWDGQTGREQLSIDWQVSSAAFSPDGQRLVLGGLEGAVKLWDLRTDQETLTLRGHTNRVRRVIFSADGHRLITASYDGTVRLWDATPWPGGDQDLGNPAAGAAP